MPYHLLMIFDQDAEPLGFYSLYTTVGPVVLLVSDPQALQEIVTYAEANHSAEGNAVGMLELNVDSYDAAVQWLMTEAPEWAETVSFLPENSELFHDIVEQLRESNSQS